MGRRRAGRPWRTATSQGSAAISPGTRAPNPSARDDRRAVDAEVGIVGAGAAGGILALELARRGIRVVVLESGPRHDFARRPEYVRRYVRGESPWATPLPGLDRYTVGGPVPYQLGGRRARGVGGSTLHWEGHALRLHANDFRLKSLYGIADDWPISYQDLDGYYAEAERML